MSFNLFGPPSKDDIRVGYIDPTLGYVEGVSICEANEYAKDNPGTTFIFRDGNNNLQYLNVNEVNRLTPNDLSATQGECGGIQQYKECGPPRIQFFGGGGIGASGNPVIGRDGSILAVDVVTSGHGYQYAPIVKARDDCQFGNGAVLTAVLGETADEIEVFEGEEDFEEYELCEPTDVGYGRRYGPNGEDLGPWEPQIYTRIGADPIQREIEIFQKLIQKPFWTTRDEQPDRIITTETNKQYPQAYNVTFPEWGEFMNKYAISPVKPSSFPGSDEADTTFSMEWEQNFPISGEYIFRGVCDETAEVYVDGALIGKLKGPKQNPSPLQKTIQEGNHIIRVNLSNAPKTETEAGTSSFVDVPITVYGEGDNSISTFNFNFTSEDGSHSFSVKGVDKSKASRNEIIKVKPNVNYKVVASSSKFSKVEQGTLINGKEGGLTASNKIFGDGVGSSNDNDDMQITAQLGTFTPSNKRDLGGRNTYNLIFKVTSDQINSSAADTKVISPKSWNQNPMGVSMIIDAPLPPVPQEQPPVQTGRCPPNPIWTTRFPGSSQKWYPVRFGGSTTVVQETVPSSAPPPAPPETQEVQFTVYGEGDNSISTFNFTFTAVDGQHTFTLSGVQKSKQTRVEKIRIRKNVNYVVVASSSKFSKVQQGTIVNNQIGGLTASNKIFGDGVGSSNDSDDIQITAQLGTFTPSNRRNLDDRTTYNLTYILQGAPGGSKNVAPTTISRTINTPGWSKFMNRYAISPVLPLNTPGTDVSGSTFSNSWEIDLPYAGFYGVKGTRDNNGRILIDGKEVSSLDGFNVDNPKLSKVFLTKGRHTIVAEISNETIETRSVIDTKIFSTQDWRVASQPSEFIDVPITVYGNTGNPSKLKYTFTSEDGQHTFTLNGVEARKQTRNDIIKVRPNVNYKVIASATSTSKVQQGTLINNREGGLTAANKIFADTLGGDNDLNDMQVTAQQGIFTSSNKRQIGGRSTYDLTYRLDSQSTTSTSGEVVSGTVKNGVTYVGPNLFFYNDSRWSRFMNNYSVSPKVFNSISEPDERVIGKYTLTWKKVNFPYGGIYKFNLRGDNIAAFKVGDREIFKTQDFSSPKVQYTFNISPGKYDITIELENVRSATNNTNDTIFSSNPMGVALYISKDVIFNDKNKTPWTTNPLGISAILIPPPCAKKIGGKGIVEKVIVEDPGNGYLPPQGEGYPVTLVLDQVIVENSGINYRCGEDQLQITPNNGAELSYDCDPFGKIRSVKVLNPGVGFNVYPEITLPSETGVNATFRPVFRVLRDPLLPPEKLIQVTDLVGLKQTGYVNGRAYYGAVYYDAGVPFAGYYKTAGPQTRVYATLQESITAQVTTPPSAIQRSGTDVTSNDPRLNIPGTIEDTQT